MLSAPGGSSAKHPPVFVSGVVLFVPSLSELELLQPTNAIVAMEAETILKIEFNVFFIASPTDQLDLGTGAVLGVALSGRSVKASIQWMVQYEIPAAISVLVQ